MALFRKQKNQPLQTYNFYDIIPTVHNLPAETVTFPGALRFEDLQPDTVVKLVHKLPGNAASRIEEKLFVLSEPVQFPGGRFRLEVVNESHFKVKHPDRQIGQFSRCCRSFLDLADIGVIAYPDGSWSKTNFVQPVYEEDDE